MKILKPVLPAMVVLLASCMSLSAATGKENAAKPGSTSLPVRDTAAIVSTSTKAVKEITALPKRKIPPVLFKEASAVIIVPKAAKKSFMVSGGITAGMLMVRDKAGTWSNPVFITLSGGTLGWQIVGDPLDIILLFRNNRQVDALLKGRITLDTKTAIVSGRVAAAMTGATKEELTAEISSYVRSNGVFNEEAVVAGTTLQIDAAANDGYYGRPKVDAGEILKGTVVKTSDDITTLHRLLSDYGVAK
jgi:lipid-binding SYLF domain-containing protein